MRKLFVNICALPHMPSQIDFVARTPRGQPYATMPQCRGNRVPEGCRTERLKKNGLACPGAPRGAPGTFQDDQGPRMAPGRSKVAQDASIGRQCGLQTTQQGPKTAQDGLQTDQEAFKTAQEGSKRTSERASRSKNYPRGLPVWLFDRFPHARFFGPRNALDGSRGLRDRPETAQEAPKRAPRLPKRARRRPKRAPRRPKRGPSGSRKVPKRAPRGLQEATGGPQESPQRPPRWPMPAKTAQEGPGTVQDGPNIACSSPAPAQTRH